MLYEEQTAPRHNAVEAGLEVDLGQVGARAIRRQRAAELVAVVALVAGAVGVDEAALADRTAQVAGRAAAVQLGTRGRPLA